MTPVLTTITPYWNRPEMLEIWLRAIEGVRHPGVRHLLYVVESTLPDWALKHQTTSLSILLADDRPPKSIGHYHNLGAGYVETDWIMKLDIDCLPHTTFFPDLLLVLKSANPRQWFNCGMFYMDRSATHGKLNTDQMPLITEDYYQLIDSGSKHPFPAGTNFVCRRQDYLDLGGCDNRFVGYGWEDYQQIYMLEAYQRGGDPLLGPVRINNVSERCRDEISRTKAAELYSQNDRLALLHRWHTSGSGNYRNALNYSRNRNTLLDYIQGRRKVWESMTTPS